MSEANPDVWDRTIIKKAAHLCIMGCTRDVRPTTNDFEARVREVWVRLAVTDWQLRATV